MTAQTDRLNAALDGRYRIERHLGEGGMATVYLCDDLKHDRKVALKLRKPELAAVLGALRAGDHDDGGLVLRRRADGTGTADTVARLNRGINEVIRTPDSNHLVLRATAPPSRDIVEWQRGRDTLRPLMAIPTVNAIAPALSPDGKWIAYASDESGRYEVYVRPYPDVNSGRWPVSQAGGLQPVWSRNGRALFYQNGATMLVSAAVLPGATFTLGAQVPLFRTSAFLSNSSAVNYDVTPDGQRFVFVRTLATPGTERTAALVQITNWAAEVRAKLAGKTP